MLALCRAARRKSLRSRIKEQRAKSKDKRYMKEKKLTYSEAIQEIEQILARLREERIDVDSLTSEVKRATELIAQCRAQLTDVEKAVKAQLEE